MDPTTTTPSHDELVPHPTEPAPDAHLEAAFDDRYSFDDNDEAP